MATSTHGSVAPGFEEVARVFREGFERRDELGAAVCVYHRGEKVVDLYGGARDAASGRAWEEDTMVLVFSTTKGMAATAMAVAHARGLFELDEPVATYWPEFAAHGKERITVRQLLSHQAGLPAIDQPLDPQILGDLDRLASILAQQRPAWTPGERHGYHGLTLGFYEGELIRRVDPKGRSLGAFFQEEIAKPLGVSFYIGLPEDVPRARLARMRGFHPAQMLLHLNTLPWRFVLGLLNPRSLVHRAFFNPRLDRPEGLDTPEFHPVEMPAAGGIGEPRAVARIYSALSMGGEELGIDARTRAELKAPAAPPPRGHFDEILKTDTAFSFGFNKPFGDWRFASSTAAFGTPGAGGSFGFCDPDAQIGFCYAMNRMGFHVRDDPRERLLREAVYRCLR